MATNVQYDIGFMIEDVNVINLNGINDQIAKADLLNPNDPLQYHNLFEYDNGTHTAILHSYNPTSPSFVIHNVDLKHAKSIEGSDVYNADKTNVIAFFDIHNPADPLLVTCTALLLNLDFTAIVDQFNTLTATLPVKPTLIVDFDPMAALSVCSPNAPLLSGDIYTLYQ